MRNSIFIFLLLIFQYCSAQQSKPIDTNLDIYFEQLPAIADSPEIAYKTWLPKDKINPAKQYEQQIQQQLSVLADRSRHQSRILSMLSDRYEQESERYDFSKVKIEKDKPLAAAVEKANGLFFIELDNYSRKLNNRLDSTYRIYKGIELAQKQLDIYRQELPVLVSQVKKQLKVLDSFMDKKGYHKVLAAANVSHPYFIQLLETRGLMLDRLLKLNQQIDAANGSVAMQVDSCKKYPELCK